MTVTISGTNYSQLSTCDSTTAGGTWTLETPAADTTTYKEGAGSLSFVMKDSGDNYTQFAPTSSKDLSGTKHVRFWFLSSLGALINLKANGGIQLGLYDGTNTGWWYVSGRDEYPGGWYQCVVDVSKSVNSGTKPTNMNAITQIYIKVNLTAGGKNAANVWIDNLIYCDGLTAYGDDGGSAFDFADIYATGIAEASGIISIYNGVYYLTGSITVGDASGTASSNFVAKNQTLVFVDKSDYISSSLYAITVVGNATGSTQTFQLGENSGGSGINGCNILCPDTTLAFEFTATDTDVDVFGLYGTTFNTYGTVDVQPGATNLEIIGCTFLNGQGQLQPNTMIFTDNFVVGGDYSAGSVLIESISHQMEYNTYVSNAHALEIPTANTYDIVGDQFSGNTKDIHFSATTGNLIISCGGTPKANPSTYTNDSSGSVTINNTVTITISVKDTDEAAVDGARVLMKASSGTGNYPFEASVTISRSSSTATVSHTSHGLQTDEYVEILGATQPEYNGVHQITYVSDNSYSFTVSGTPDTPATGTITATFVLIFDTTSSGEVTDTMRYRSLDQPFVGRVRKSSGTPLYKQAIFSGTIENSDYNTTVYLVNDE